MSFPIIKSSLPVGSPVFLTVFWIVVPFPFGEIVIAFWFARNRLMMKNMIGMTGNDFVLD